MGRLLVPLGGGGGASSDECTATANDILKGKTTITKDSDDEIVEGTMPDNTGLSTNGNVPGISSSCPQVPTREGSNLQMQTDTSGTSRISIAVPKGYYDGRGYINRPSSDFGTTPAGNVLSGSTFTSTAGINKSGTMTNNGAKTASLNCGGSYTIPAGYHNGSGKITANSLSSQTSGTAAAGSILNGKTAWVNGSKVTGNIASLSGGTYTPSTSAQTIYCSGKYMTGNITFNGIPNGYVNVNGNADLFNNGSFGTIAGGAKAVIPLPTSNKDYCFQYQSIVNNRLRWTRTSDVYTARSNSQQPIVFKKKIPFQHYSWIEIEGYNSFAFARYRPIFLFGNSTAFVTIGTGFNNNNITYQISYGNSNGLCGWLGSDGTYHWNNDSYSYINGTGESTARALVHVKISNITEACYFGIQFPYGYGLPTGSSVGTVCDISRITLLK